MDWTLFVKGQTEPGGQDRREVWFFDDAGLGDIEGRSLHFEAHLDGFEDWWAPFPLGVGPFGEYPAGVDPDRLAELNEICRQIVPSGTFDLPLRVWAVRGVAT